MGVEPKIGVVLPPPKWMVYFPIKMDDLEVPLFLETRTCSLIDFSLKSPKKNRKQRWERWVFAVGLSKENPIYIYIENHTCHTFVTLITGVYMCVIKSHKYTIFMGHTSAHFASGIK